MRRRHAIVAIALAVALVATACGGGDDEAAEPKTIKVAYLKFGTFDANDKLFKKVKPVFEQQNPGTTLELVPIEAPIDTEYHTKLSLMQRSESTAPDVLYEDSFRISSDVQAGYLRPLDDYLAKWQDWGQYFDAAKQAGRAQDGKTYGVLMGTDTRGLWYNKELLGKAGLPQPWQPKSWEDVLAAARQIKAKVPDVIPFNIYSGKPMGEASSMQGFEMLLYGTGHQLYNHDTNRWIASSPGTTDSFRFIQTVFEEGLAPKPQQALNPNFGTVVATDLLPKGKLAIALDGSWLPQSWLESSQKPWPEWSEVLATTPMPTQNGQPPGKVSMSGGWTLAISAKSRNPDAAWKLIELALNKENSTYLDVIASQIAPRRDVAAEPQYLQSNPTVKFWTDLVEITNYRPTYGAYPQISNEIAAGMEAVMTGQASPEEAAKDLADSIRSIAGADQVEDAT
jgi:multiple sugar transport system substrate-binding protein